MMSFGFPRSLGKSEALSSMEELLNYEYRPSRTLGELLVTYGLMICDDLIFTSRVTATARAYGQTVKIARSAEVAERITAENRPVCVLVDLHTPGLDLPAFLTRLTEQNPNRPRIVAYASHVDTERLKAARAAGCDQVLPRSQFVRQLETELVGWLTES